jgi:hypothetical protein
VLEAVVAVSIAWDAFGVALFVTGLVGLVLIPRLWRRVERQRLDAEVAEVLDGWDADADLLWLLAEEGRLPAPLPSSDEDLLDVAHAADVVPEVEQ